MRRKRCEDKPPPFAIQLTDERGVELFEVTAEPKPAPLTDEDKVFAMIAAEPGVSGNRISEELEIRRETVSAVAKTLEQAGRIKAEGKGRAAGYVVVEQSLPELLPAERSGSETGNDSSEASDKSEKVGEVRNA